jgi:DNA-binding protein YbaB
MSIVPTTPAVIGVISTSQSDLAGLLREWMKVQDEISAFNAELKQRRVKSKALKDVILRIMQSNNVATINISKGTVIHKIRETAEKMNDDYILKHCKVFFNGDETKAQQLVDYLNSNRATTVKHDLKLNPVKEDDDSLSRRS